MGNPVEISHFSTTVAHKLAAVGLLPRPDQALTGFRGPEDLLALQLMRDKGIRRQ
jgi:hypothetical protein